MKIYRHEVTLFNAWCASGNYHTDDLTDLDECLVHYVHEMHLSKTRVGNLYAGVALALPRAKKNLPWLLAVLNGMQHMLPAPHTLPMPKLAAIIIAVHLSQCGYVFAWFASP